MIFLDYIIFYGLERCDTPRCNAEIDCQNDSQDGSTDPVIIALSVIGTFLGLLIVLCIGLAVYCCGKPLNGPWTNHMVSIPFFKKSYSFGF